MATHSQCYCLKNPMDRGAWWATVHSVTKSWTRLKRLGIHTSKMFNILRIQIGMYACPILSMLSRELRGASLFPYILLSIIGAKNFNIVAGCFALFI